MAILAVDWGSTTLRAYLLDDDGQIVEEKSSALGLKSAASHGFERALKETAQDLLDRSERVLMCGMVGARKGWVEAPYCPCPAGVDELAASLAKVPVDFADVRIVPGVSQDRGAHPDVMRGEETQVFGSLTTGEGDGTFALPGTHTKWVQVENEKIVGFRTFVTGDVYQALKGHTVLGMLMEEEADIAAHAQAYAKGVEVGSATGSGGALLAALFGTRTLGLFERMKPGELATYLSGMLVGAEVSEAKNDIGAECVVLVGGDAVVAGYEAACGQLGVATRRATGNAACRGLAQIARMA